MDHKRPVLISTESVDKSPLLILDKKGIMGVTLAKQLHEQYLVVLATDSELDVHKNIIHIPYRKKIPTIPDNHYSHLFVFYNGESEILDMLPALMKKANTSRANLVFVTSLPYSNPELFRRLNSTAYRGMQIVLYGEVFSHHGNEHNLATLFLNQASSQGRIQIPNDGMGKLYPVFFDDVYDAIVATAFGWEKKKLTYVFPQHPISEMSVARMLQKKNPLLRLDFVKFKGKPPVYYIPTGGDYFYPEYPLEKRLQSMTMGKEILAQKPHKKKQRFPRYKKSLSLRFFWITLICLLLSPILITVFAAVSGAATLQLSIREVEKGKVQQAQNYAVIARESFSIAQSLGSSLFYLDPFMKAQKAVALGQITTGERLAEVELDVLRALSLLGAVNEDKSVASKEDFTEALAILKNSLITVQKMRAEGDLPAQVNNKITSLEPVLLPLENTIDAFPALLGFQGKREYLVLFQNNMELRPGGGFIGSYGLVKMDKGRVIDFTVHDVYDADGKLTTHIDPPYGLQRYMNAKHWFLRDSNFAIDFPQNAKQAETFLQLETGVNVDGVIAIDTTFLKNMLSAIGSVTIPDYHETVTADNFYLLTQNHAEKDFFPGSTQKKDFLRALLAAMQEKLLTKGAGNYQAMIGKIGESIVGKHLLFVFSDEAVQQLFTVNNLSGSLLDNRERGNNSFLDFFGVIDANVGANKINYYMNRQIDQKVRMDDQGKLTTTATITYVNTSTKDSPFGGDYRDYVRFVLPVNAALRELRIDDRIQPTIDAITNPAIFTGKNFLPPKELEIDSSSEQGKDSIGFLLTVPIGTTKKISLVYDSTNAVDMSRPAFLYDLWLFKQPGSQDDAYTFTFSYPSAYRLVHADSALSDVGGKLVYSNQFTKDINLRAEFSRK